MDSLFFFFFEINKIIIRFVCISDTHTLTNGLDLPKGDVLIHAGDFSNVGLPEDIDGFVNYLDTQDFKYKISKL